MSEIEDNADKRMSKNKNSPTKNTVEYRAIRRQANKRKTTRFHCLS